MAAVSRSLLVIGHVWPEPSVSAAGSRMMQLLVSFKEAGFALHFGTPAEKTAQSEDLEALGIQIHALPLNEPLSSDTIRDIQPDGVIFDRYMTEEQFGWRVQEEAPQAVRILNMEDLHSLRKARKLALEAAEVCDAAFWMQQEITLRELSAILRCDLSLVISKTECEWLHESGVISSDIILYLPFMLDSLKNYKTNRYNSFKLRSNYSFIGYGRHAPNSDAVRYLIQRIWSRISREIPEAELHIYGKDYPAEIQAPNDPSARIFFKGWTRDIHAVLSNTRVNLAPLRFGAGLKGKIVHATEQGTPTVTTTIGAEGLFDSNQFASLIADDPDAFAAKAMQLYRDEALWQQTIQDAQALLAQEMDRQTHHDRLHKRIESLLDSLVAHRERHLLGRILRYQGHQSARYMAKWIEAKKRG